MEDIVKEYIDYTKQKSNIEEVANKKLVSQNEKFLKLKEYVKENHDKELDICRQIASEFENMDILKSYYAANFVGHSLHHEDIIDDEIGKNIINLFFRNIDNACRFIENAAQLYNVDEDDLTDDDIARINIDIMYRLDYKPLEAFIGIDMMIPPVMTVICSNQDLRKYFINLGLEDHIEYLETYVHALSYVHIGIEACYKTKILVLSPKVQRGFYIEASDMSNGYYLITLLEAELYKKGLLKRYGIDNYEFNETIYNIAAGNEHPQELMEAEAHQQYYTMYALQKDGTYNIEDENGELDCYKILYSDMSPEEIPDLDGTHILIMDSEGMWAKPVKWDISYFTKPHQKLKPYVKILDEISDEEYNTWIEKIKNSNS
ncbi:hypothetical protein OFR41_11255 [Brachyspira hyodysenteriae]|uniref:Uncharacterized protein n=1 Tax=Brachyspira hyodysenteriae (strain ATCC 49526 / WA1) TaxID=565034 RepID=A0A3B6VBV1_BRAHW|nr:hypothetical protein [Brachyspira hyodysenteriae]ACN84880.1 hypothetical protein BHWA1_02426 [Brachyspira hyodysenteriae WA1]KLI29309.1 hypothetical protein SZ49_10650 [Brachyspira hyodysenteriae]KLI42861.1 hypothetical protein SZ40_09490 [Brachyspira hyodysenteriae]KLI51083.1 hypothetical protein SZ43_11250 [Brachyspira hyodysenteriae]KLI57617.1 hypothetical protein SZ45_03390 [Brachyspira hyodysenteriae]